MIAPLDETSECSLSSAAYEAVMERVDWADVVVVGPGLSRVPETQQLILKVIPRIRKPIVLDADALFAVAADSSVVTRRKQSTILTPHTGELAAIIGMDPPTIELRRVQASQEAARLLKSIVCLKGSPTSTATPHGDVYLNSTGNPGMATIGSGDVLTGVIAGFLSQGMVPVDSAYSGVLVHGLAGDLAASMLGQRSVMAMDILDRIPDALKALEKE
jgi:NAD(P)H-hydrate epimerase